MMTPPPPQFVPAPLPTPEYQPQTAVPPARFPTAQGNALPAPRVRGVAPDPSPTPLRLVAADPPPAPLVMPSPEQLGITTQTALAPAPAPLDWDAVHRRLDRLGITCFHLEKLTPDVCRVVCLVPTAQENRQQRIEATGKSQAEAVQRALLRAEECAAQRR